MKSRTARSSGAPATHAFWVAMAAIPFVFFVLLEGGLRLFDYGENTDLFVRDDWKGTPYYRVNPNVVRRYFSAQDHTTYVSRDRFLVHKPDGLYRIFFLGASTTIGYPYMFNGAPSALLAELLARRLPDVTVEVVNVGITAINSFAVDDIARETLAYEPDLLVVYMGHNEFYGPFGVGSSEFGGLPPALVRLTLVFRRTKTFQLLDDLIGFAAPAQDRAGTPAANLMERVVADPSIGFGSEAYRSAVRSFERNYRRLVTRAQAAGVDVVVCTVASNLADQVPFVSLETPDLTADRRGARDAALQEAEAYQAQGDWAAALTALDRAAAIDSSYALVQFGRALIFEALGDSARALEVYRRARDLDGLRFRAPGAFNTVIRALQRELAAPLADVEAAFAAAAPGGIPGSELFWEHVHPRLPGYALLAGEVAETMARHGRIRPAEVWVSETGAAQWAGRESGSVTPLDEEVARLRIEILTARWPFREKPETVAFQPQSPMQEVAWDYVRNRIGWAEAHKRLGDRYATDERFSDAATEYLSIAKMTPYDPYFFLLAGDMWARDRRYADAVVPFERAITLDPNPVTHAKLGIALYENGALGQAIEHFNAALRPVGGPGSGALSTRQQVRVTYLLGLAALRTGDAEVARRQLDQLRSWNAEAAPTRMLEQALAGRNGTTTP